MLVIERSLPPVLLTVTACAAVEDPTVSVPKLSEEGLTVASAAAFRACIICTHSPSVTCPEI
jgi:hypothetical protein